MNVEEIEAEERNFEYKQNEFMTLAREICCLKRKTNELEIQHVAKERQMADLKIAVIKKQTEFDVLKTKVAFLDQKCKEKVKTEKAIVEKNQERKRKVWEKYKNLVIIADDAEKNMRKYAQQSKKAIAKQNEKINEYLLTTEIEVLKDLLAFQERKKKELMEVIGK